MWWTYTSDGFLFHDGDNSSTDPNSFTLLHHRWHLIKDVEDRRDSCWNRIIDEQIVIPAHSIKLYDVNGNKTGRLLYSNHEVTTEYTSDCQSNTSTATPDEIEISDTQPKVPEM